MYFLHSYYLLQMHLFNKFLHSEEASEIEELPGGQTEEDAYRE